MAGSILEEACGRHFATQEIREIREIIDSCQGLSRTELASTVCELLDWKRPNGRLKTMENLTAYLIRSSFSQQRMEYLPHEAEVRYQSKDGKEKKTYHALEWLAAMPACARPHADRGTHVPHRRQQSVKDYG